MKKGFRRLAIFVVIYGCSFFLALLMPGTLHRSDFDRAYSRWLRDPTPETRAALDEQMRLNDRAWTVFGIAAASALTATVYLAYGGLRFTAAAIRNKRRKQIGNN